MRGMRCRSDNKKSKQKIHIKIRISSNKNFESVVNASEKLIEMNTKKDEIDAILIISPDTSWWVDNI
jgi:hypothetical protein